MLRPLGAGAQRGELRLATRRPSDGASSFGLGRFGSETRSWVQEALMDGFNTHVRDSGFMNTPSYIQRWGGVDKIKQSTHFGLESHSSAMFVPDPCRARHQKPPGTQGFDPFGGDSLEESSPGVRFFDH